MLFDLLWKLAAVLGLMAGVATSYEGAPDAPLYVDQFFPGQSLTYGGVAEPWVAVDWRAYGDWVEPGDVLLVVFEDRPSMRVRALDAGRLADHYVACWPDLPILVDVPRWLVPGSHSLASWKVIVVNLSKANRRER